jgi:hypothetical protein
MARSVKALAGQVAHLADGRLLLLDLEQVHAVLGEAVAEGDVGVLPASLHESAGLLSLRSLVAAPAGAREVGWCRPGAGASRIAS